MKPNTHKIKSKPRIKRPKARRISTKPRRPKILDPKKFRAVKIGKGVKRPKTRSMQGMINTKTLSKIKNEILDERASQKQDIAKLNKMTARLKTLRISLPGLQELSDSSIKKIHKERLEIGQEIKELSNNLAVSTKRLSQLEIRYKKLKT